MESKSSRFDASLRNFYFSIRGTFNFQIYGKTIKMELFDTLSREFRLIRKFIRTAMQFLFRWRYCSILIFCQCVWSIFLNVSFLIISEKNIFFAEREANYARKEYSRFNSLFTTVSNLINPLERVTSRESIVPIMCWKSFINVVLECRISLRAHLYFCKYDLKRGIYVERLFQNNIVEI